MRWKESFTEAMKELEAIRGVLDDPAIGLAALNKDLTQRHMKILETVQGVSPAFARRTANCAAARNG